MNTRWRKALGRSSTLLLGAVMGAAPFAQANEVQTRDVSSISLRMPVNPALAQKAVDPNENIAVFVQFDRPSVAEFRAQYMENVGKPPSRQMQIAYANSLRSQQAALRPMVRAYATKELGSMRVAANGVRIRTTRAEMQRLRQLPGVKSVAPVTIHEMDNAASVGWVGAPAVWDTFGDGAGMTVAIIDSGIDYTHAALGGSGNVDDYNNNDFNTVEPGTFPTAKVIGGFDFAGPTYTPGPNNEPQPDGDPIDGNGHGTHVAGTAAGIGVDGVIGAGVAKGAFLYAYKVFNDTSGSTDLVSEALEASLDPNGDGSMDDHVDVVNMSLGSPWGDPNDPSAIATSNAVANGIIVVASAGNSGDIPYITGSPAVAPEAISVASSISGGRTTLALGIESADPAVDGLHSAIEGDGAVTIAGSPQLRDLVEAFGPADDGVGNVVPGEFDSLACHPLDNGGAMRGKIALVSRGNCTFDLKFINVQAAGGRGVVVHNDGASPDRIAPIAMGGIGSNGVDVNIPGLMISATAGFALSASLNGGTPAVAELNNDLQVAGDDSLSDTLSGFTSRGPGHGGSQFKPDIAAPGDGITSALTGSGSGPLTISGTSMAAPHVAGAAALLKQVFPQAQARAIKAIMQNTSEVANIEGPGTNSPYPLARQGVGVLRVDRAATASSVAFPAGQSFGRVQGVASHSQLRRSRVVNFGSETQTYTITHEPNQTMDGVTVSCPTSLEVAAGASGTIDITLDVDPSAIPSDDGSFSQSEVDGWCVLTSATDTLRVGYLASIDAASRMGAVATANGMRVINNGESAGWAEGFTLAGIGGNEGTDLNHGIGAFGFRTANFDGSPVVEFGLGLNGPWESLSNLLVEVYVDVDEDGVEDTVLQMRDWSAYDGTTGTIVTAQFALDANGNPDFANGFTDWLVTVGDYNDHVVAAPFSIDNEGGFSFLPAGDTNFNYRLVVSGRDGTTDSQTGTVELSTEVVPDTNSFSVGASSNVAISASQPGDMLWLFQNNPVGVQFQTAVAR